MRLPVRGQGPLRSVENAQEEDACAIQRGQRIVRAAGAIDSTAETRGRVFSSSHGGGWSKQRTKFGPNGPRQQSRMVWSQVKSWRIISPAISCG